MFDTILWSWLVQETAIVRYELITSTNWQLAVPADPNRFGIIATAIGNSYVQLYFGDTPSTYPTFTIPQNGSNPVMTLRDYGDYIRRAIWAKVPTAAPTVEIISLSFNPTRRRIYDEFIRRFLSEYGAL